MEMQADIQIIIDVLKTIRLTRITRNEYELHQLIGHTLALHHIEYEKEFVLGPRNRIDYLVGSIGIETKMGKPSSRDLEAQATRYAQFDRIGALILVVERNAFHVPSEVNGKPVHYVALNNNWGIAL